jgi:hypothetical protein
MEQAHFKEEKENHIPDQFNKEDLISHPGLAGE